MASETNSHATISVIGLGAWGSALAYHCTRKGHRVIAWSRDTAVVGSLTSAKRWVVAGVEREIPSTLTLTSKLSECAATDATIMALPASAWRDVAPHLSAKITISATKGLEPGSGLTPLRYAHTVLGRAQDSLCVISGPSFASDLVKGTPISIVAASLSSSVATYVAQILSDNNLRLYTSSDTLGVELGGILKNIIAIAVGISDALGYGPSTRAALIARGLAEMTRIATAMGAEAQTLAGLSGLGDLIMTATEEQSRNRTVGLRLGRGEKIADIIATLRSTAEGVSSAPLVEKAARQAGVEAPITSLVVQVLSGAMAPKDVAHALMSRPLKSEF